MKPIANNDYEKTNFEIPPKLKKILSSNDWYRSITETMLDGLIATDMNHNIVFVNTLLCKMLRFEKNELLGTSSFSIVADEDRNRVMRET